MKPRSLVLGMAMAVLSLSGGRASAEISDVDQLIDTLVQKGVITAEAASAIRAESAIKKQEEKEKQKEFCIIAGKQLKIAGYTQVRFQFHSNLPDIDADDVRSFDIRRARLDFRGAVTERFDYRLQLDFARCDRRVHIQSCSQNHNRAIQDSIQSGKSCFKSQTRDNQPLASCGSAGRTRQRRDRQPERP